jgi:hypothetical protein
VRFADPTFIGKLLNISGPIPVGIAVVECNEEIGGADEEGKRQNQFRTPEPHDGEQNG